MASLAQNMTTFPTYMASCWLLQVPRSLLLSMTPQTELTMTDDAVASLLLHYTSTREESTLKTPEERHHKAHCVTCCKIPSWNETPAQKNLQAKIPPAPNPCPIKVLHGKCPGIHTDSLHSWDSLQACDCSRKSCAALSQCHSEQLSGDWELEQGDFALHLLGDAHPAHSAEAAVEVRGTAGKVMGSSWRSSANSRAALTVNGICAQRTPGEITEAL